MSLSTPPAPDQFEVSIIGPGIGECVILHLGDNEWCVVDSCIPRGLSESAATHYLNGFQNGAPDRVRLIVATHWHDDHIRGLASILKRVPTAHFFCSSALNTDDFFTLVETSTSGVQHRSGVDEFGAILNLLQESAPTRRERRLATPGWAIENRMLLRLPGNGRPFPVTITALSPSDATLKLALTDIAQLLPKTGDAQRRIPSRSPNHTSVVLWVEAGPMRALLGSDLEHRGNASEGWMAVLQCHKGRHDPQSAVLFKVPHHGSVNADYPTIWPEMLEADPIAIVTPFNGGRVRLPRDVDLGRLSSRTKSLYCTARGPGKVLTRDAVVEKMMRQQATERRVVDGQAGHVRARWSLGGQPAQANVEVFHGAYQYQV